jgi:hypothetical protein
MPQQMMEGYVHLGEQIGREDSVDRRGGATPPKAKWNRAAPMLSARNKQFPPERNIAKSCESQATESMSPHAREVAGVT